MGHSEMGVPIIMKGVDKMNVRKNIDYSEMYEQLDMLMAHQLPQMELYCEIGKTVCLRTEKGAAVMASEYLNKQYPSVKGFSPRSLRRMRDFYRTYESYPTLLRCAMQLGWIHNVVIMEAELTMDLREWYMKAVKQFDWSKTELIAMIASEVHQEIVLDNEVEICDNINSEKGISYISVKNGFQLFLEQLVRYVVQQRCRGKPPRYPSYEYGSCIEIWGKRKIKNPVISPRLQRSLLRNYRFREMVARLRCEDILTSSCIHVI